jgi:hypothetical protein
MLTFKKFSIQYPKKDIEEFFIQLLADSEKWGNFSHFDKYYRGEFFIEKPWAGNVDTINKEFKINWVDLWRFGSTVTSMSVNGKFIPEETLEIKITLGWNRMFSLVPWLILLSIFAFSYFEGILAWVFVLSVITIQVLLSILSSNNLENKFREYIDKHGPKIGSEFGT